MAFMHTATERLLTYCTN